MKPKPIVISYCSGDMLHADFAHCLTQLAFHEVQRGTNIGTCNVRTTLIEVGRIRQVVEAREHGCSHILFLDSDMKFPRNTLERLLRWQKPLVGCTYSQRRSPRALTHQSMNDDAYMPADPRERLFEVKSLGFGCFLIAAEVFDKVPRPWFRVELKTELDATGVEEHRSEDRTFCDRAREAGYRIYCDAELSQDIEHVGTFPFRLEHVEVWPVDNWIR